MRFESLGKYKIALSETHRFGTDAVLLADFAAPRGSDRVCDLGTGCGILPLLWCQSETPPVHITGVDIQPEATALFAASVAENGLEERVCAVTGDLRSSALLPPASFDRVTSNPPYFPHDSGEKGESAAARIARHEGEGCTLDDVTASAARLLRYGGAFCLCHRPERLCDVLVSLRQAGLEPKRLRFVHKQADSRPWLFLCEAKKGGKAGVNLLPPLVLYERDGTYTAEYRRVYSLWLEETL